MPSLLKKSRLTPMFWGLRAKSSNRLGSRRDSEEWLGFRDQEIHLVRKAYRRSIGITLQVNGRIRVTAPKGLALERIQDFLRAHSSWIDATLAKYNDLRARYPRKRFVEGEVFPFLGRELRLSFAPGSGARLRLQIQGDELQVTIPRAGWDGFSRRAEHPELATAIAKHFAAVAKAVLQTRVLEISERMRLFPKELRFRSQKTRWGSCSTRGLISLNWRLIVAPVEVIDYVIVHELAHLAHHNHSSAFWNLVASEIPDYQRHKQWLKAHQFTADFLAKRSELHPD